MVRRIYILGHRGPDAYALESVVCRVMAANGLRNYMIKIVDDPQEIFHYGVTLFPALVVDGFVRTIGRVPSDEEFENILYLTGAIKSKKINPAAPPEFLL